MQRWIPWLLGPVWLLAASGVAAWWSLHDASPPSPASPPPAWSVDMQAVADGNNEFAFDLYGKLREENGNLFF